MGQGYQSSVSVLRLACNLAPVPIVTVVGRREVANKEQLAFYLETLV